MLAGYQKASAGLATLQGQYEDVATRLDSLNKTLTATNQYFTNLEKQYSDIGENQNYQAIKMTVQGSQTATKELAGGLQQLNAGLKRRTRRNSVCQ